MARFNTLTLHFDRVVRQFPGWGAFIRNAAKDRLTAEQAADTAVIAAAVVEALSDSEAREFINAAVPSTLGSLAAQLQPAENVQQQQFDPIEAGNALLAEDVLESINNIAKAAGEMLLASAHGVGSTANEMVAGYGGEAKKSLVEEAKRLV